jgi:hypothetical protein
MYCSNCREYIPKGLDLTRCPSCDVDIVNIAPPREKLFEPLQVDEKSVLVKTKWLRRFGILGALVFSFFSSSLYVDVGRRWKGGAFLYSLFLTAIVCFVLLLFLIGQYEKRLHHRYVLPLIEAQPTVTLRNGEISIDQPSPYVIKHPKTGEAVAIFDVSGPSNSNYWTNFRAPILVTKEKVIISRGLGGIRTLSIDPNITGTFSPELLLYLASEIYRWSPLGLYPLIWLTSWVLVLLLAFTYSAAGTFLSFVLKSRLGYAGIFRVTMIAVTPMLLILSAGFPVVNVIHGRTLFLLFLPLAYLLFGICANRLARDVLEVSKDVSL